MNDLVVVRGNDIFTDSLIIAKGTGYEHHTITRKIRDYTNEFKELGNLDNTTKYTGGNPMKIYNLNEPQASYLITLLENNEIVRKFKLELVKEFYRMRWFILEKQSAEWQQARITGKQIRLEETDIILAKLIPLAERQGSKNPEKLYMVYSKLVNMTLGIDAEQRNNLPIVYVDAIKFLERAISNIISIEVDRKTHYKEIYCICKAKCLIIKDLAFLPTIKQLGA